MSDGDKTLDNLVPPIAMSVALELDILKEHRNAAEVRLEAVNRLIVTAKERFWQAYADLVMATVRGERAS